MVLVLIARSKRYLPVAYDAIHGINSLSINTSTMNLSCFCKVKKKNWHIAPLKKGADARRRGDFLAGCYFAMLR
jgi:hypothetical protein